MSRTRLVNAQDVLTAIAEELGAGSPSGEPVNGTSSGNASAERDGDDEESKSASR
jgi:hypothetical protein